MEAFIAIPRALKDAIWMRSLITRMVVVARPNETLVFKVHPPEIECDDCAYDNETQYPLFNESQMKLILGTSVFHMGSFDEFESPSHLIMSVDDAIDASNVPPFVEYLFRGTCDDTNFDTSQYEQETGYLVPSGDYYELRVGDSVIGIFQASSPVDRPVSFPDVAQLINDTRQLCGQITQYQWRIDSAGLIIIESLM